MIVNRDHILKAFSISVGTLKKYEKEGLPRVINEKPFRYILEDVIDWFKNRKK